MGAWAELGWEGHRRWASDGILGCRQQGLLEVLKAYTLYRPEQGYCQAQGPVAAVLLMHLPPEVSADPRQSPTLLSHAIQDPGTPTQ